MHREPTAPAVEAELDIFSGRPNPRWMLSPQQTEWLSSQLKELSPITELLPTDVPNPLRLGYRGFILTYSGQDARLRKFRVYDSVVTAMTPEGEAYYRGAEEIEAALLESARSLGHGEVIDHFRESSTDHY